MKTSTPLRSQKEAFQKRNDGSPRTRLDTSRNSSGSSRDSSFIMSSIEHVDDKRHNLSSAAESDNALSEPMEKLKVKDEPIKLSVKFNNSDEDNDPKKVAQKIEDEVRAEFKERIVSKVNKDWKPNDLKSIKALFKRLSVDKTVTFRTFLKWHNDPLCMKLISHYLEENRGELYPDVQLKVENIWTVDYPGDRRFRHEIGNLHFLMQGASKKKVLDILKNGFYNKESAYCTADNLTVGPGYYFQTNSQKAVNLSLIKKGYERMPAVDNGELIPADSQIGYIFFCHVALGRCCKSTEFIKDEVSLEKLYRRFDSAVCQGIFKTQRCLNVHRGNVKWPLGPFKLDEIFNAKADTERPLYDDIVVREANQIRLAYLVEVKYTET
ncbi:unnamed protein product [Bursaphelenchus okinawaensis]|uniref:PARP catalytic domain-containing protein n=1 Tax=Bursaphelenchus okinawaensis TaxID=465554 RepID=A0A811K250_9BILA|nr:unnamed protein product [Bursaphelenchus okinawaensis]CAG9089452.1 unnamed protein product [Bursaphelenchus okinawaensis]